MENINIIGMFNFVIFGLMILQIVLLKEMFRTFGKGRVFWLILFGQVGIIIFELLWVYFFKPFFE